MLLESLGGGSSPSGAFERHRAAARHVHGHVVVPRALFEFKCWRELRNGGAMRTCTHGGAVRRRETLPAGCTHPLGSQGAPLLPSKPRRRMAALMRPSLYAGSWCGDARAPRRARASRIGSMARSGIGVRGIESCVLKNAGGWDQLPMDLTLSSALNFHSRARQTLCPPLYFS